MKEIYKLTINVWESETYRGMKSSHNFALQNTGKKASMFQFIQKSHYQLYCI